MPELWCAVLTRAFAARLPELSAGFLLPCFLLVVPYHSPSDLGAPGIFPEKDLEAGSTSLGCCHVVFAWEVSGPQLVVLLQPEGT